MISVALLCLCTALPQNWPEAPDEDATIELPAQEWPRASGPRSVPVHVRYPGGALRNMDNASGVMLSLHNWGGTDHRGAPEPQTLANRLNVAVLSVDYLQSGPHRPGIDPPYDHGLFQALDALRALWWMIEALEGAGQSFDDARLFAAGGSGGGNVALMANKLAPCTFACVVDLSGMARLSDAVAYGEANARLNAGYSRDPESPRFLAADAQQIRDVGRPEHLSVMQRADAAARIIVVHGTEDASCSPEDKHAMVEAMEDAGLEVRAHFVTPDDVDDGPIKNAGHSIGDRTELLFHFAGGCLAPEGPEAARRHGQTDFARRETLDYPTRNGAYVVSFKEGYPTLSFEPGSSSGLHTEKGF